jgi:hypothetical protein
MSALRLVAGALTGSAMALSLAATSASADGPDVCRTACVDCRTSCVTLACENACHAAAVSCCAAMGRGTPAALACSCR